jgi:hypothetical protein
MSSDKQFNNKRTHKTDAILKLLTRGSLLDNPFLNEKFKDNIILTINNNKSPEPRTYTPGEEFDIDIIAELAAEFLPSAIDRFGCCKCDRCFARMLENVVQKCPHALVKVRSQDDFKRAEYLKRQHRNTVLRTVVSEAIAFRKHKKHVTPRV